LIDLLQYTKLPCDNVMIASIEKDIIMPSWRDEMWNYEPNIRELGIKALGVYCMLSKEYTLNHLWIFYNLSKEDNEVAHILLQSLMDFQFRYDFNDEELTNAVNPLQEGEGESKLNLDRHKYIDHLCSFLTCNNVDSMRVVVEGFCKLLMSNKLTYKKTQVLCTILLLNFTPNPIPSVSSGEDDSDIEEIEEDPEEQERKKMQLSHIKQILALFFPLYAKREFNVRNKCRDTLSKALIECVMTISKSNTKSPLRGIPENSLIRYVFWLLDDSSSNADGSKVSKSCHTRLAYSVLHHLKHCKPQVISAAELTAHRFVVKSLSFILSNTNLGLNNGAALKQCKALTEEQEVTEMIMSMDRHTKANWEKFNKTLDTAIKKYEAIQKQKAEENQLDKEVLPEDFADLENDAILTQQVFSGPVQVAEKPKPQLLSQRVQMSPQKSNRKRKLANVGTGMSLNDGDNSVPPRKISKMSHENEDEQVQEVSQQNKKKRKRSRTKSRTPKKLSKRRRFSKSPGNNKTTDNKEQSTDNESEFVGVYRKEYGFEVSRKLGGKLTYGGSFISELEAAKKSDELVQKYEAASGKKPGAYINFPLNHSSDEIKPLRLNSAEDTENINNISVNSIMDDDLASLLGD